MGRRAPHVTSRHSNRNVVAAILVPFVLGILVVVTLSRSHHLPDGLSEHSPGLDQDPPTTSSLSQATVAEALGSQTGWALERSAQKAASLQSKQAFPGFEGQQQAGTQQSDAAALLTQPKPQLFLFIGVLSGRGYRHRRLAVREGWANQAQHVAKGTTAIKFILSEDERTPQVLKEEEQYGDLAFLPEKTNYKSILFKTFFIFQYAAEHFDFRYVLKTDDDTFVNVRPMLQQLRLLCRSEDCRHERIYMGHLVVQAKVETAANHKWNNVVFHNHTGLNTYPTYAMGGGYVLSADVVHTLLHVNQTMKLKFTPIEDATVGFWLMSMDLRFIHHPKILGYAAPCCFKLPVRREGQRIVTRFQLEDSIEEAMCTNDPWLILHKIESPTKMRFVGNKANSCPDELFSSDASVPSLAPYMQHPDDDKLSTDEILHQEAEAALAVDVNKAVSEMAQQDVQQQQAMQGSSIEKAIREERSRQNIMHFQDMVKRNEAETRGQRETALAAASAAAAAEALQQEQAAQLGRAAGTEGTAGAAVDPVGASGDQLQQSAQPGQADLAADATGVLVAQSTGATGGAGTALDDLAVLPRQLPDLGVVHQQEQNEQRQLPTDLDAIKQQEEKSAAQLLAERVVDGSTVSEVADSEHR